MGFAKIGGGGASAATSQAAWDSTVTTNKTFTNSDFTAETTSNVGNSFVGLGAVSSGVHLYEIRIDAASGTTNDFFIGLSSSSTPLSTYVGLATNSFGWRTTLGELARDGLGGTLDASVLPDDFTVTAGTYYQIIVDFDNNRVFCGRNGDFGGQDPVAGTNPAWSGFSGLTLYRHVSPYYSGLQVTITNPLEGASLLGFASSSAINSWGN
ncbi:MAG: hypothetical protein ACMVO3_22625 [Thalassobaculum sp.]